MNTSKWSLGAAGFRGSVSKCWFYGRVNGWNMVCITDHVYRNRLAMWNLREAEWEEVETPPGATIDELKALAVVLLRMNN